MKNLKFGYYWIWLLPYYYIAQVYLAILAKWFPERYKRRLGRGYLKGDTHVLWCNLEQNESTDY